MEPAGPAASTAPADQAPQHVDAVAPAAARADADGDLLTENVVTLPLQADGRDLGIAADDDEHGHAGVALRSGTVSLPSNPEMPIIEDVAAGTPLALRTRHGAKIGRPRGWERG